MIGFAVLVLLAALSAPPAAAQEAAAPQEPDIVLPEVILRIEDFRVESFGGAAPGGEEALPAARELPLPAGEEPLLAEPPAPPAGEPQASPGARRPLSVLAELGAGTANHLYGQLALNSLGEEPRYSLRFLHESLDPLGGEASGSGYDLRREELEGALRLGLGQADLELEGSLHEQERGLQQQSTAVPPAASRLFRTGELDAELAWPFAEAWTLRASLAGGFATERLTVQSGEASGLEQMRLSPGLSLEARTERFWVAVDGRYGSELYDGQVGQRAAALARFGVELSESMRLEGSAGWHWSQLSGPEHLVPFHLALSFAPGSSWSFVAAGGYRVEEPDLRALARDLPWAALPTPLEDDHGWFADFSASFSLQRAFSLQAAAHLSFPRAELWEAGDAPDTDGLFDLVQQEAVRAAVEASLRWTPSTQSYLGAGWRMELAEYPRYVPGQRLRVEGGLGSERWGVNGTLLLEAGHAPSSLDFTTLPLLSLGGFLQAGPAVRVSVELEDLLSPLASGGQRRAWGWDPFLEPGLRATGKVQINL